MFVQYILRIPIFISFFKVVLCSLYRCIDRSHPKFPQWAQSTILESDKQLWVTDDLIENIPFEDVRKQCNLLDFVSWESLLKVQLPDACDFFATHKLKLSSASVSPFFTITAKVT